MTNQIIVEKDKILTIKNNVIDLIVKEEDLVINIEGHVLINNIEQLILENSSLTINLLPNSELLMNSFNLINPKLKKITFNQQEKSQLYFNYASLVKMQTNLIIDANIKGDNNITVINVMVVTQDSGQVIIEANGNIEEKTINNRFSENLHCLTMNEGQNKIIPNLIVKTNETEVNHSATIGPIDQDELFYLLSKGISETEANLLIRNGFLVSRLNLNDQLKEKINQMLKVEGE